MSATTSTQPHSYRDREEYQLARALLADVCMSIKGLGQGPDPHAARLRRSAVALPNVFLPTAPKLSLEQERDSQRLMLQDLAEALGSALESGTLDPATADRLETRRKTILQRMEALPN